MNFAQSERHLLNMKTMEQDLEIMESVLDRLLLNDYYHRIPLRGISSKGMYIPDYGVVFVVTPPIRTDASMVREFMSEDNVNASQRPAKELAENEQPFPNKNLIQHFMLNYNQAIRQLKQGDHLVVVLEPTRLDFESDENEVCAVYSGLIGDFRTRTALDSNALGQEIQSSRSKSSDDLYVLANIFKTTLNSYEPDQFILHDKINALSLDRLGNIIYFAVHKVGKNSFDYFFFGDQGKKPKPGPPPPMSKQGMGPDDMFAKNAAIDTAYSRKEVESYFKFEDKLVDLMLQYGSTMKNAIPSESLVVAVKILSGNRDVPTRVILQAKYGDLQAVSRGKISRNVAVNRLKIDRYF